MILGQKLESVGTHCEVFIETGQVMLEGTLSHPNNAPGQRLRVTRICFGCRSHAAIPPACFNRCAASSGTPRRQPHSCAPVQARHRAASRRAARSRRPGRPGPRNDPSSRTGHTGEDFRRDPAEAPECAPFLSAVERVIRRFRQLHRVRCRARQQRVLMRVGAPTPKSWVPGVAAIRRKRIGPGLPRPTQRVPENSRGNAASMGLIRRSEPTRKTVRRLSFRHIVTACLAMARHRRAY